MVKPRDTLALGEVAREGLQLRPKVREVKHGERAF